MQHVSDLLPMNSGGESLHTHTFAHASENNDNLHTPQFVDPQANNVFLMNLR